MDVFKGEERHLTHATQLNFSLKWCRHDFVCTEAYRTIEALVKIPEFFVLETHEQTLMEQLPDIVEVLRVTELEVSSAKSLFSMLLTMMAEFPKECVMQQLDSDVFATFFDNLSANCTRGAEKSLVTDEQVETAMLGLELLHVCAESPCNAWKLQLDEVLQLEVVQVCLMKAVLSKNGELIKTALELLRVKALPRRSLAKVFANRRDSQALMRDTSITLTGKMSLTNIGIGGPLSPYLQNRLEDAIDKILNARAAQELQETSIEDVLEIFEYKITMCNNQELYLLSQIQDAATEVTFLRHQNALLESEMLEARNERHGFKMIKKK